MSKVVFCLGANTPDAEGNILHASSILEEVGIGEPSMSGIYPSSNSYLNRVIVMDTPFDYDRLLSLTKDMERILGREPGMKDTGVVPIDIDIVVFDGEVKREFDYRQKYFRQGLEEINQRF